MNKPKYDKETLNQFKDIDQDKRTQALSEKHQHDLNATNTHIRALQDRVKVLEDARTRQIILNTLLRDDLNEVIVSVNGTGKQDAGKPSFFDRFF